LRQAPAPSLCLLWYYAAVAFLVGAGSGGQVNPAVSLIMLLKGTLDPTHFVGYIGAQLLGALAAYYAWKTINQLN
jgi:aquaporin Z